MLLKLSSRSAVFLLLAFFLVFFLYFTNFDASPYKDGDSSTHYLYSHYAWQHPINLMNNWAKPLFVLISSPFSRLGMEGMILFNVICALSAAYLSYLTALKLNIERPALCALFTLFAPVFFVDIGTGLTEVFFSLVLIGSIYLFSVRRFKWAAVLISFLPYCRSEGFLILPVFGVAFLLTREYKALAFMTVGSVLYSIAGVFVFSDPLWFFHSNPYSFAPNSFYGHGVLLHYVAGTKTIGGIPLTFAFVFGLLLAIILFVQKVASKKMDERTITLVVLVFGSFMSFYVVHSWAWWKGMFASLGLHRVMACIMPLMGIGALYGINAVLNVFKKYAIVQYVLILAFAAVVVDSPVSAYHLPDSLNGAEQRIMDATRWMEKNYINYNYISYTHPFTAIRLDIDPWDLKNVADNDRMHDPDKEMPKGSILFWESLLGYGNAHTNVEKVRKSPHFKLLYFSHNPEPGHEKDENWLEVFQKID